MSGTNEQCRVLQFTNSNTSRLGSQRANTETWTKSSSQNSVAVAALPPFTATPPLPNSAVATTMAWGTVRSAMAECQRSSWCMYKLSCSQRHRHSLCSWRTRTAAAARRVGGNRRRRIRSNRGTRDDKRTPLVCTVKSSRAFGFTPFSLSSP